MVVTDAEPDRLALPVVPTAPRWTSGHDEVCDGAAQLSRESGSRVPNVSIVGENPCRSP